MSKENIFFELRKKLDLVFPSFFLGAVLLLSRRCTVVHNAENVGQK